MTWKVECSIGGALVLGADSAEGNGGGIFRCAADEDEDGANWEVLYASHLLSYKKVRIGIACRYIGKRSSWNNRCDDDAMLV